VIHDWLILIEGRIKQNRNICFIPLHTWLPDAYPRAHFAASVFLSVYTTKLAVYLLARTQPPTLIIAYMGGIMAVYGVSFAVLQNDMRRLLSYHIISQVGYMVAGIGLFSILRTLQPLTPAPSTDFSQTPPDLLVR
jgi:multicomponent Na+:H+ antiporter subunit D